MSVANGRGVGDGGQGIHARHSGARGQLRYQRKQGE
jgi:hypothetical protein